MTTRWNYIRRGKGPYIPREITRRTTRCRPVAWEWSTGTGLQFEKEQVFGRPRVCVI